MFGDFEYPFAGDPRMPVEARHLLFIINMFFVLPCSALGRSVKNSDTFAPRGGWRDDAAARRTAAFVR
jgi:hypothetical protein